MSGIRRPTYRIIRFAMVGCVNSVAAYAMFAVLLRLGLHYSLATFAGSLVGMAIGFKLHGAFVFDHPGRGRFIYFTLIFSLVMGLSLGIQAVARVAVDGYTAGAIAASITIPISFILNRTFVFQKNINPGQGS